MTVYRPPFIKQLDGSLFGGRNCTMASASMAAIRHTRGVNPPGTATWYPTPAYLRGRTGDSSGGTTLAQADAVLLKLYNINLDVEYLLPWASFRNRIVSGEGAILQGGYAPIRATKYTGSETFTGNHAVYVNEARYNESANRWEYLWYDPLCDGRREGIAKGPQWLPESLVRKFSDSLIISGTTKIKAGYVYAAFTKDTEDVILKFGGTKLATPATFRASRDVRIRRSPHIASDTARTVTAGTLFRAYQKTATGDSLGGSRVWYGNQDGVQWIPSVYGFTKVG